MFKTNSREIYDKSDTVYCYEKQIMIYNNFLVNEKHSIKYNSLRFYRIIKQVVYILSHQLQVMVNKQVMCNIFEIAMSLNEIIIKELRLENVFLFIKIRFSFVVISIFTVTFYYHYKIITQKHFYLKQVTSNQLRIGVESDYISISIQIDILLFF